MLGTLCQNHFDHSLPSYQSLFLLCVNNLYIPNFSCLALTPLLGLCLCALLSSSVFL
ncbi:hypothetical protein ACE6H2_004645 [Prunus campanulata]